MYHILVIILVLLFSTFLSVYLAALLSIHLNKGKKVEARYFVTYTFFFLISTQTLITLFLLILSQYTVIGIILVNSLLVISLILLTKTKLSAIIQCIFSLRANKYDFFALLFVMVFILLIQNNIAEWFFSGPMDAGRYINIAYSFINNGSLIHNQRFDSAFSECLDGFICESNNAYPLYLHIFPALLSYGLLIFDGGGIRIPILTIVFFTCITFYTLIYSVLKKGLYTIIVLFLLCFNPIIIIYSKEVMSEILGLFFLMNALLFLILYFNSRSILTSFLFSISLSLLLLTKLDSIIVVLVPIVLIFMHLFSSQDSKNLRYTFIPFIFVGIYYSFYANWYTTKVASTILGYSLTTIVLFSIPLFSFILSFVNLSRTKFAPLLVSLLHKYYIPASYFLISIAVVILVLRPLGYTPEFLESYEHDQYNPLRLAFFLTWISLVISFFGLIAFIRKEKNMHYVGMVLVLCTIAYYTLISSNHTSPLYWWSRRYILFAVPLILFLTGYGIKVLLEFFKNKRLAYRLIPFILIPAFLLYYAHNSISAFQIHKNKGINKDVQIFADSLTHDALIVYYPKKNYFIDNKVITSVSFIYDHPVLRLKKPLTYDNPVIEKVKSLDRVYFVNPTEDEDNLFQEINLKKQDCQSFSFDYSSDVTTGITCSDTIIGCTYDDLITEPPYTDSFRLCLYEKQ